MDSSANSNNHNFGDDFSFDSKVECFNLLKVDKDIQCQKYWYRWYICFVTAALGMFQGAVGNTWGPISASANVALGFSAAEITMLTNWAAITIIAVMPIYLWLLNNKGLRPAIVSAAFCMAVGTGLRCLPLDIHILKYFIHAGQILNGISGCPVMVVPPLLSNVWFPPEERVTATGITSLISTFGTGAAFIIGPLFVQEPPNGTQNISCLTQTNLPTPSNSSCKEIFKIRMQIHNVMYFYFGITTIIFIAMFIYFPNKPPNPPSISASKERLNLKEGLLALKSNKAFFVITLVGGLVVGTYSGWSGVMSLLLKPLNVTQNTSDWMGFAMTLVGCAAGILVGWLTDRLKGRMKKILAVLLSLCLLSFVYFVILTNKWFKFPPFLPNQAAIWAVMIVFGITINAPFPLMMEMSADSAYPINEGTSSSITVWFMNIISFVFLLAFSVSTDPFFANYVQLGSIALALLLVVFCMKEINQRLQIDTMGVCKESSDTLPDNDTVDINVNDEECDQFLKPQEQ